MNETDEMMIGFDPNRHYRPAYMLLPQFVPRSLSTLLCEPLLLCYWTLGSVIFLSIAFVVILPERLFTGTYKVSAILLVMARQRLPFDPPRSSPVTEMPEGIEEFCPEDL